MVTVSVLHKAPADSLAQIRTDGLRCGTSTAPTGSEERTHEYLDQVCPDQLRVRGLDRDKSTYCYLGVEGCVVDVESGELIERERWSVGPDAVRLLVRPLPGSAYVSDLDAYDDVRALIDRGPGDVELRRAARRYWARVLGLAVVSDRYCLRDGALTLATAGASDLPHRLERVEVMVTRSVPASAVCVF